MKTSQEVCECALFDGLRQRSREYDKSHPFTGVAVRCSIIAGGFPISHPLAPLLWGRFDFALRLANELEIDVNEICSASPFSGAITEEEIYPTLPNGLNGALDGNRVKTYLKNSMYPLMYLFGKNSMPDVDNLLTSFYQLDDEARKEVVETIQFKLQYHRDPERAEQIKQIKGW